MKARMKTVLCGSATVFAFTVLSSTVVFAAPSTDSNNIEDSVWSYRAVADVDTQVNIRANASTKSEIVGYLPKGASADLIERARNGHTSFQTAWKDISRMIIWHTEKMQNIWQMSMVHRASRSTGMV